MTEQEFIEAVEATGVSDVEVKRQDFDLGAKRGVALKFVRDGNVVRNAVAMPSTTANDERAYEALLDWVKYPV